MLHTRKYFIAIISTPLSNLQIHSLEKFIASEMVVFKKSRFLWDNKISC
jgi:hypothetical protein